MMSELLKLRDRSVCHVEGTSMAVDYIADQDLNGVLVNAPALDLWKCLFAAETRRRREHKGPDMISRIRSNALDIF